MTFRITNSIAQYGMTIPVGLVALCLAARPVSSQRPAAVLRPGIVIDNVAGAAYVMTEPGGIAAIDLTSGAARWRSTAGAKPLALIGDLLVAQVEPRPPANRLELVTLRTRANGAAASRSTTNLPTGVRVTLGETLQGTFDLQAEPSGADVILHWTFIPAPVRGIDDQQDTLTSRQAAAGRAVIRKGALRVRAATGAVTTLDPSRIAAPRPPQWLVPQEAKLREAGAATAAATQYQSADGQHILASERVADDRVWEKYRWTIFQRSGQRVGEMRTHISFSPFVVRDSLVVFETKPYARAGQAPEPAKLRAVSVAGGREVWSVPVREIVYRGSYPP